MRHRQCFNVLCASLLLTIAPSQGKELAGAYTPATTECPSPEEARAKMTVPDGYEVRCFAHEPMVQNPVAMTWDHRGRLWVVEAYEYPNVSPHPAPFGGAAAHDQYQPMPKLADARPRDRVVILEDTDNDGTADKRTVFVEGLNLASAIICGDNGIYVGQQPHLIHFRDDNADDKPDAWRVVLTGFGREDTHELVNSFCWGPDGWLYMTHGVFTHSKVRRPGQPEKEGFKFDAGIGRARPAGQASSLSPSGAGILPAQKTGSTSVAPETEAGTMPAPPWEFEVFADGTSNPWGCDYDADGNFFVSACVIDHFFHMAPGGIYVRQGGAPENPYAYEQLPSIVKHKHFRAAYAGVQIYQGGRYPQDTDGHAFIGNIHDNAIHEEIITPVGASFKCEPRRDFLRANNGWFRPVSTQTGPDGFLWVMDWCDKYPCYQNAKANPEGVNRDRGRIWRVVYREASSSAAASASATPLSSGPSASATPPATTGGTAKASGPPGSGVEATALQDASRPSQDIDLNRLSTTELVKTLEHTNNWMRRMARRMLVERNDPIAGSELNTLVASASGAGATIEALWTLHQCGMLDAKLLDQLATHRDPQIRRCVATLSGERVSLADHYLAAASDENIFKQSDKEKEASEAYSLELQRLGTLAQDADVSVRSAVATGLRMASSGALTANRARAAEGKHWRPLANTMSALDGLIGASANSNDPLLEFKIWMSIERSLESDPEETLSSGSLAAAADFQPLSRVLTHKAMRRLCDTRDPNNLDLAIDFCDKIATHDILLAHALDGLVKGQEGGIIKPTREISASLAKWRAHAHEEVRKHGRTLAVLWGDEAAVKEVIATLHDSKKPEKDRITVLQSLRKVRTATVKEGLKPLLTPNVSAALGVAAIRAAADLGGDDFIPPLLKQAASSDFNIRTAALEALASRETWTKAMLDAIAEGEVSANGFPAPVRRQLATSKDKVIRDHAFRVLGAWQDSSDDLKALIAAKKQAALTGEPDLAHGKFVFQATCMACHEFHGGGQKVGPDLIGSGRSNLDALLTNVIDPNQIIGNGYENITVTTKDGQTLAGRIVEDTPNHVKLMAAGGAVQTVSRDQVAALANSKQSLMPMGFGNLPDAAFRDMIWYILAPPEEGPLTKEKKEMLIRGVEIAEPAKPKGTNWRAIDWESVSLWNPEWKVSAPDFERTPVKLADYYGRSNVLLLHPFDHKKPASFERKLKVQDGRSTLTFAVAADDRGDWEMRAIVNGQEVKRLTIDHEKPRWKEVSIDLSNWADQDVTIRLETHATDWAWEFAYWHGIELK